MPEKYGFLRRTVGKRNVRDFIIRMGKRYLGIYMPKWDKRSLPRPKRYLVQDAEDNIQLPWLRLKKGQRQQSKKIKVPCSLLETGMAPWTCLKKDQMIFVRTKGSKLYWTQLQKILTKKNHNMPRFPLKTNLASFFSEVLDNNEAQWIRLKKYDGHLDDRQYTDDLYPSWTRMKKNNNFVADLTQSVEDNKTPWIRLEKSSMDSKARMAQNERDMVVRHNNIRIV